ncbi:hypothetical protein [Burkholderia plantarii]|uniref:hypothetical protein n=1 Tax=Burkholderia plantarii TaxID=41899 RepID=UPI003FD73A6E
MPETVARAADAAPLVLAGYPGAATFAEGEAEPTAGWFAAIESGAAVTPEGAAAAASGAREAIEPGVAPLAVAKVAEADAPPVPAGIAEPAGGVSAMVPT